MIMVFTFLCQGVVELSTCSLLHEGDLLELDPTEGTAMQRIHAFLLSDGLLLAPWIPNRYDHKSFLRT